MWDDDILGMLIGAWVVGGVMLGVIATLVTLGICRWFGIIA